MTDAADLARRLERAERAASTYHAWLRVLLNGERTDIAFHVISGRPAPDSVILQVGAEVAETDAAGAERLIDQPWREAFPVRDVSSALPERVVLDEEEWAAFSAEMKSPRKPSAALRELLAPPAGRQVAEESRGTVCPEHGPWCSGHGTFTMPDDAPTPPIADLVTPRSDGGVDIAIDHPRGAMRWELPGERALELQMAIAARAPAGGPLNIAALHELATAAREATGPDWRAGDAEVHRVFCRDPEALGGPVLGERVVCTVNPALHGHPAHADGAAVARYIAAAAPDVVLALLRLWLPSPSISAFAINLGRSLILAIPVLEAAIARAELEDGPPSEMLEAVRAFGGGGLEGIERASGHMADWRGMAAQWTSLVTALRPLVPLAEATTGLTRSMIEPALRALRWFTGLEPEPPTFEPPTPIPPEVLERLDALRATVPDPGSVFEAPIRRELDKIREEKVRRMSPLPKIPPKRGGRP